MAIFSAASSSWTVPVDARIDSEGNFDPGNIDCDATIAVEITRWKPIRGTNYWTGNGEAVLMDKSGEKLWSCTFEDYPFEVRAAAGKVEDEKAAEMIARLFLDRLPQRPPLPRQ